MPDENKRLSRRLFIAVTVPILLLAAMSIALGVQLVDLTEDARWVDHTDEVIALLNDLQRQMSDQETAIRGFLLTGDPSFQEAYETAHPRESIVQLRALVSDNAGQVARTDELLRRYETWRAMTTQVAELAKRGAVAIGDLEPYRTLEASRARKQVSDEAREVSTRMLDIEHQLRKVRILTQAESTTRMERVFVGLFVATALFIAVFSRSQMRALATTYGEALEKERIARQKMMDEEWVRTGQIRIAEATLGEHSLETLSSKILEAITRYVQADVGAVFTREAVNWKRRALHALDTRGSQGSASFAIGEGLVGAAAEAGEIVHLRDVPADFLDVRSGTGTRAPVEVVLIPARTEDRTLAMVELGFLRATDARSRELFTRIGGAIAIAVRSTEYHVRLQELLEESQRQGEELQTQQEELRVANEELEEQGNALRQAHAQLEERKDELEATNARLEEQTNNLQRAQQSVTEKANEADRASRYKSEFLANMSHELRTPLNSSLILAKLLADNKHGNLSEEQVRFAQTIYSAGNDLLTLINDILDLSKIEAGRLEIQAGEVTVSRVDDSMRRTFEPLAREKKVAFSIDVEEGVPEAIVTDVQRLEQILKNLLSNAIKFTDRGEVSLRVTTAENDGIAFHVRDTGIGIAAHQRDLVFEAFRQADSASNRKFTGTGLGLSISRELARRLGGEIALESELGKGSTFTLTIPRTLGRGKTSSRVEAPSIPLAPPPRRVQSTRALPDDREHIDRRRRLVLVIEDDVAFARVLYDLAHELDFQCILAHDADAGIALANEFSPSAILLDVNLPDHSGLSVLDRLKRTPSTRHIPVHMASVEDRSQEAMSMGAVGYVLKPVKREELVGAFRRLEQLLTTRMRRLLIVEDDAVQRESLGKLLGAPDVETIEVGTVKEALEALAHGAFDCVVTDLSLPDASGFDLLERIGGDGDHVAPPVIVYTGRVLNAEEETRLRRYSSSIIVKGARSPERLIDEVTLFLHQVESELPPERQRMLKQARDRETVFEGKRILVVEDDARNIFALSSILEPKGATVLIARNGREALTMLEKHRDVDLVLMDIMMPEMDGIEATIEIRKRGAWPKLPIIALTAKAMKDDRERCLRAGANDYVTKPLDVEMLLSLLRVWMPK